MHTSNSIINHNADETSVSDAALGGSLATKVSNLLEALTTAFGGWSQIGNIDIARAIADNIRNQGWGQYKALDLVHECAKQYGTYWNMTAAEDKAQADEILIALTVELTAFAFQPFDEVITFAEACAKAAKTTADASPSEHLAKIAQQVASEVAGVRMLLDHARLAAVIRPKEGADLRGCLECMAGEVRTAHTRTLTMTPGAATSARLAKVGLRDSIVAKIDACVEAMATVFTEERRVPR